MMLCLDNLPMPNKTIRYYNRHTGTWADAHFICVSGDFVKLATIDTHSNFSVYFHEVRTPYGTHFSAVIDL